MLKLKNLTFLLMLMILVAGLTSCDDGGAGNSANGSVDPVPDFFAAWTFNSDDSATGSGMSGTSMDETGTVTISTTEKKVGGGSAYFDGSSHLDTSSDVDFNCTEGITVSLWVNITSYASSINSSPYLQWGDGNQSIRCGVFTDGYTLYFTLAGIYGNLNSSQFSLVKDTWSHITFTVEYDAATGTRTVKGYYNGESVFEFSNVTTDTTILSNMDGSKIVIGEGFNGYIDDVRFYNRVLSDNEVQAIYNFGS